MRLGRRSAEFDSLSRQAIRRLLGYPSCEAFEETPVRFPTHWRAPFTGGGNGTIVCGDSNVKRP
jgi:hypothetical protein